MNIIRLAKEQDTEQLLQIYAYYVKTDTATFEEEVPSLAQFRRRVCSIQTQYPYLVYERDKEILGYAYASRYKERAAYRWDVEVTIYVKQEACALGIGKQLYRILLELLKRQGVYKAYACITGENKKSIRFHERFGFHQIALFAHTGYKFGRWLDVVWLEYTLHQPAETIAEVISISEMISGEENLLQLLERP